MTAAAVLCAAEFVDFTAAGFTPATAALEVAVPADPTLWRTTRAAAGAPAVLVDPVTAVHDLLHSPGPDARDAAEQLRAAIEDGTYRGLRFTPLRRRTRPSGGDATRIQRVQMARRLDLGVASVTVPIREATHVRHLPMNRTFRFSVRAGKGTLVAHDWTLGIDFGTSNTAAAHTSPAGNGVQVLALSHQSNLMPSALFVEPPQDVYSGDAALNKAEEHPQALLPTPKRMLGFGMASVNGYEIPPSVLVAAILQPVYERALAMNNNQRPSRVVLTHPEAWSPDQVKILTDAAASARIDPATVTTISEPRAAVHYYTRTMPLPVAATIAVFDFGAGTLDAAVLNATDTHTFEVVAARGDNALGGKNFDALVRRWVDEQLTDRDPQLLEWLRRSAPPQDIQALDGQICRAKELLSDQPNATIRVTGNGRSTVLSLTREEFEQIIDPQVDRALELTRAP